MENSIIKIYKKRKYNEFLKEKREKISQVENPYQAIVDEFNEKLLELLKEDNKENLYEINKLHCELTTKEVQEEIDKIEKEFKDKMDDRNRLVDEVMAQIELCSSREEMLEVYKAYGILDENNKIYDYR